MTIDEAAGRGSAQRGHATRVAVVGAGNVGASFAYALLLSGLAAEIVLIDLNRERAEGEAMDLAHAVPFAHPTRVWAGDYADCAGAAVTVITAGASQRPGETRLELVARNAAIFRALVPRVAGANPGGLVLVATNPVDVLTHTARLVSRLRPRARVFGFTPDETTARRINLLWGVTPVLCAPIPDLAGLERAACRALLEQGVLKGGDEVVLTGGHPLLEAEGTNLVKVVRL
jgi:threonine dehydrogenase-like Zn-dependent dehydrogenase